MPTSVTIHRNNGETATMHSIDAREACRNHPHEWSYQPFSAAEVKAVRTSMLLSAYQTSN